MRVLLCFLIATLSLYCQTYGQVSTVVSGEYFFDTDPGFGNGTPLPAFAANSNVDLSFPASSSGLSGGIHILGIRIKDSNNIWSIPSYTAVYVLLADPFSIQNISAAEYFFDSDPGAGNGTPIATGSPATIVDVTFAAASSGLSTGIHILAVRAQSSLGEWGIPSFTPVYADRNGTLTKLEYFFDNDPGVGSGTEIAIDPATDALDQSFTMGSSSLAAGTHTLSVRAAGLNDFWSMPETVTFVVCPAAAPSISPDIACVGSPTSFTDNSTTMGGDTYAWDFDGDGLADNTNAGGQTFTYPAAGTYTATLSIDRSGCIATTNATVTVDDAATAFATPDQAICETGVAVLESGFSGPNVSGGTWATAGDGAFDNPNVTNVIYTPGPNDIAAGTASVTYTTQDPAGACPAAAASVTITVGQAAIADAGPDLNVCTGGPILLSGSIAGSAATALWTTAGDGSFDDATALNVNYSPGAGDIANGAVDIHLTTDDPAGACSSDDDEMVLSLDSSPAVDAGADVAICGNASASLSATTGGPATPLAWTTAGDGTFDDGTILTPSYTPGPNDLLAGSVVLTLTTDAAGGCPSQSDQVTVSVTKDISLAIPGSDAAIGVSAFVTVTQGGTFNPGDVLVSTILAGPKKGTAQLAGDVLEYTASSGTVGEDSVQVRVCNQCGQCDSGFVYFNILNSPPVLDVPPSVTRTGEVLVIPISSAISDANGNADLSTVAIVEQPLSGAVAAIDQSFNVVIDYKGINFSGTDQLTVEVCDDLDACSQSVISIQVNNAAGEIEVYNAVAPNSTGDNRFMRILNLPPGNKVSIYNRWGDNVFEVNGYDHAIEGQRFEGLARNGHPLPSGVYFYRIETDDGTLLTGYLSLRQ